MSFYDNQQWSAQGRQPSWEQQLPPQRSSDSPVLTSETSPAFLTQLEEVERAIDNLSKSGKVYAGGPGGYAAVQRREPFALQGRGYSEMSSMDSRSGALGRYPPVNDYGIGRPNSTAGMPGMHAPQRISSHQSEHEQMLQAKRRLAAQRERELRNYHQEQQYSRGTPGLPADRPLSPSSMNEDERRDLIARQHRALYGHEPAMYPGDIAQKSAQDMHAPISAITRGASPLAYDAFSKISDSGVQLPPMQSSTDRRTSISPPSGGRLSLGVDTATPPVGSHGAISPVGSPALTSGPLSGLSGGIAPIGSRQQAAKRSTTPIERSASGASQGIPDKTPTLGGWGSSSGVWGAPKSTLGVQASVWG